MLTACGIETLANTGTAYCNEVATVLTACGIETILIKSKLDGPSFGVATVLTACGIETTTKQWNVIRHHLVATVLTACGIETLQVSFKLSKTISMLQQCLPLAVLKL